MLRDPIAGPASLQETSPFLPRGPPGRSPGARARRRTDRPRDAQCASLFAMHVPLGSRTHAEARTDFLLPCTTVIWQKRGCNAEVRGLTPVWCSGASMTGLGELKTGVPLAFNIAKLTSMSFVPTFAMRQPKELVPSTSSGAVVRRAALLAIPPRIETIATTARPPRANIDICRSPSPRGH